MGFFHVVADGEHLSKIAKRFGFRSFRTVWDDPANDALRALRPNPNVLLPGDRLFIPDKQPRSETRDTGKRHTFVAQLSSLKLRICAKDRFDSPLAGEVAELEVDGSTQSSTTGADGLVERTIALDADGGSFVMPGVEGDVRIGRLHPIDSVSGWLARLNNLGYDAGEPRTTTPATVASAVEEFQCDVGLPVTGLSHDGTLDDATQAALLAAHGC